MNNKKHLCMNCMSDMGEFEVCMNCGWTDETGARELYHLQPRSILAGRYEVGMAVGFGGFGVIYRAWDMQLNAQVAIKEFYPSGLVNRVPGESRVVVYSGDRKMQFEEGKSRFLAEARTMAKFSQHPHIVNVYDFFEENNTAYIVMEFLDGVSLKSYLKSAGGKISIRDAIEVITPVMDAVKAIHKEGIVHRDISPDNIFILPDGRIKLIDFGAARLSLGDKEQTLSVVLKPGYAPPEQYRSKSKQGPFTDIYALGATLYRMVTGEVPEESVDRLISDDLKLPTQIDPLIPSKYESIILKAMAINASLRFQTIEAMEQAIHSDSEILRPEEQRKRIEKGRRGVVALAAIGVAAVLALVAVAVFVIKPQERLSVNDIEPCTIATYYDDNLRAVDAVQEMIGTLLHEDGDVITVKHNEKSNCDICFTSAQKEVPADAAPLDKLVRSLNTENYLLLGEYREKFEGENWIALGFDIPVIFYNAKLMSLYEIPVPYIEDRDSYASLRTVEDYVNAVEPIVQVEGCLPLVVDAALGDIPGTSGYRSETALNAFCNNNGAVMFIGMLSNIDEIQQNLPGYYSVGPLPADYNALDWIDYYAVSYIRQSDDENIANAAMAYLSYYFSEDIQTELFITNANALPMEKTTFGKFINTKYPSLSWLGDFVS